MTVPILICECGMRLKVAGAAPGKEGRCPNCGATLRVPDRTVSEESSLSETGASEPTAMGYGLEPAKEPFDEGSARPRTVA